MNTMKNHILLGTQRIGSSAISKLINLHPEILSGLEWTQKTKKKKKLIKTVELLSGNFRSLSGFDEEYVKNKSFDQLRWIGFKVLFSSSNKWIFHPKYSIALWADHFNRHLKWLRMNNDIHIIHLVRGKNIEWIKSVFMAKETKLFSGQKYPVGIKLNIDIKNAISRIKSKAWIDKNIETLKATNPYCKVYYEDFEKDNKMIANRLTDFLDCDSIVKYSQLNSVKQSKGTAIDYIKNHDKLVDELRNQNLIFSGDESHFNLN